MGLELRVLSTMPATVVCAGQRDVWPGGRRASSGGGRRPRTSGSCPPGTAAARDGVSGRRNQGARQPASGSGGWNLPRSGSARTPKRVTAGTTMPFGWPPCMTRTQSANRSAMPAARASIGELPFRALLLAPSGTSACQPRPRNSSMPRRGCLGCVIRAPSCCERISRGCCEPERASRRRHGPDSYRETP